MTCKRCNKELDTNNLYGKGIFCSKSCQIKYAYEQKKDEIAEKSTEYHKYQRITIIKECKRCGTSFEIERLIDKSNKVVIDPHENSYCTRSCANSGRINTEETAQKRSATLKETLKRIGYTKPIVEKSCLYCGSIFQTNTTKKYCCVLCNNRANNEKLNLVYRKDEIPIKNRIESLLQVPVAKEHIQGFYIDFASSNYLIEYTTDATCGVQDAIRRFSNINDSRKQILITHIKHIGSNRRARIPKVQLVDIAEFWKEDFKFDK